MLGHGRERNRVGASLADDQRYFERGETHWHHAAADLCLMQYQHVGEDLDNSTVIFPEDVRTGGYATPDALSDGSDERS